MNHAHHGERPFFRSYGASLPSSLTWFLPSALVCSTRPPVSVCGTVRVMVKTLRRFSWRHGRRQLRGSRGSRTPSRLGPVPGGFACLAPCALGPPIPAGGLRGLPRHAVASTRGPGNFNPDSIGYALRPRLRGRLTLGGRTWPRKPWTCGGRDFNPPFRYSCLHGRSHGVHPRSRPGFAPHGTLSYQYQKILLGFGCVLESRSFSARNHSASELLRTL
jgi:hypothetical protein